MQDGLIIQEYNLYTSKQAITERTSFYVCRLLVSSPIRTLFCLRADTETVALFMRVPDHLINAVIPVPLCPWICSRRSL